MGDGTPDADLIDIRRLRSFLTVAQEMSFTRAGARLYLTQQAVSSQVRALEHALGTELFRRTTRNVQLTAAGRELQDRVRPALQALDDAISAARELGTQGGRRTVRVGHTPTAAYWLLPYAAGLLDGGDPAVCLRTEEHTEMGLRAAVADGRVHLGVGLELESGVDGLAQQVVGGEPWCAVVGPDHPLASRGRVRLAELTAYEWLTWPRSSHPGYWHAVHALASSVGAVPMIHETWLSVAHARLTAGAMVMLRPVSYTAHPLLGLIALELEDAPMCRYGAVWNEAAPPLDLPVVLSALTGAAGRLARLGLPGVEAGR
ncbi:LysR family transcriptional regulator [Streptomyces sp. NPDC048636]|uniref:LysR family transcriptional regulator n=1 Tax=Streptomyces sp. NPDC048636 TaxID=3155762 RepID=UPI00341E56C6